MTPPDDPIRPVPMPSDADAIRAEIARREAAIDRFRARVLALPVVDPRSWEEIRHDLTDIDRG
jgi:hypothetical protein